MKRFSTLFLCLTLALSLAACGEKSGPAASSEPAAGSDQTVSVPNQPPADSQGAGSTPDSSGSKVLIAYFSFPEDVDTSGVDAVTGASVVVRDGEKLGNTQYVAQTIQETIGGDLFRIETVQQYPLDHDPLVDQASDEKAAGARPELSTHIDNLEQYDTVLLGYPNWWADLPMPLYSFLEEYDLSGKTVIPFVTHGGSRASRTIETISRLQPDALVQDSALVLSRDDVASSAQDVADWAAGLNLGA